MGYVDFAHRLLNFIDLGFTKAFNFTEIATRGSLHCLTSYFGEY
jgi:hypothetical protein